MEEKYNIANQSQQDLMKALESGMQVGVPKRSMIKGLMMKKRNDFIDAKQAKANFAANSNEGNALSQVEDNIVSSLPEIQQELQGFQEGAQEFMQDLNSFSKSANPDHITALSNIYAGNYKDFTEQDGERGFLLESGDFVPLKQINMMQRGLNRPDFKTYNELKTNSFAMQEKIAKEGPTAWNPAQAEFQISQRLDDVADGQGGNDPMRKKERYLSLMTDTFNNDKSFSEFLNDKYPKINIGPLTELVNQGNYDNVKPFLTEYLMEGATSAATAGLATYNANNATSSTQPEIDFSSADAIDNEINRLKNLSQQERYDTDYREGSVEGSVTERIANLEMRKEALNTKPDPKKAQALINKYL